MQDKELAIEEEERARRGTLKVAVVSKRETMEGGRKMTFKPQCGGSAIIPTKSP